MKHTRLLLLLLVFYCNANILLAQATVTKKYSIALDFGLSRTFHYNQPVNLTSCIEGCLPEKQRPSYAPSLNLSLYRDVNEKNSVKVALGAFTYKYWEEGLSDNGDGRSFSPYEIRDAFNFYTFSGGFRHIFNPHAKVKLFIEEELIYEKIQAKNAAVKNGVANMAKVGANLNFATNWGVSTSFFYRTALTNYNQRDFGGKYIPFAFGLQLGVYLKL